MFYVGKSKKRAANNNWFDISNFGVCLHMFCLLKRTIQQFNGT